jgi:hypothetical protein
MKQGYLATAAFWVGLLTLFGWQASADQALRPPLPIPNVPAPAPKVVALMPPTVPLTRSTPTPIPPPAPEKPTPAVMSVPSHIPLPPAEYDHEYKGN